jgi:alpha-beta hydrolase superfamily lysophospholipase
MSRHVLFIHGAWVGPACWQRFRGAFADEGFTCATPAWPHDDRPYQQLRDDPAPELARVGIGEITDHYEAAARAMPEPPLLVGHSFGGLIVQRLLDRGVGAGGVAIDSAPPRGVFASPSALRAALPALLPPLGWRRVLRLSYSTFAWAFVHGLGAAAQRRAYDEHVIPTPGRPYWQLALAPVMGVMRVDYAKPDRAPLLLVAGGADRTVTAAMNRKNHALYARHGGGVDFKEFAGRSHWTIVEPGWEDVAGYAMRWARQRDVLA